MMKKILVRFYASQCIRYITVIKKLSFSYQKNIIETDS